MAINTFATAPWQKRHALQIASQLPDDLEDALLILRYAREIIERLHNDEPPSASRPVLAFKGK
jgi:hypothetical protein